MAFCLFSNHDLLLAAAAGEDARGGYRLWLAVCVLWSSGNNFHSNWGGISDKGPYSATKNVYAFSLDIVSSSRKYQTSNLHWFFC